MSRYSPPSGIGTSSVYGPSQPRPASFIGFMTIVLREHVLILRVAIAALMIGGGALLVQRQHYSAESSFTPQGRRMTGNLTGLAAQLGLTIPSGDAMQNSAFYVDLVKSRAILGAAVTTKYRMSPTTTREQTLVDIYGVNDRDSARAREIAIDRLKKRVTAAADPRTGVVSLTVEMPTPGLAYAVNLRLLDLLNEFNLRNRRSQAAPERVFAEERFAEVKQQLSVAEARVTAFEDANRNYRNSPQLVHEHDNLTRAADDQRQIYMLLLQMVEQARLDEARDTPVITVVEQPELPARPDKRRWVLVESFALIVGLFFAVLLAYGRTSFGAYRDAEVDESTELNRAVHEFRQQWRQPKRLIRTLVGR